MCHEALNRHTLVPDNYVFFEHHLGELCVCGCHPRCGIQDSGGDGLEAFAPDEKVHADERNSEHGGVESFPLVLR